MLMFESVLEILIFFLTYTIILAIIEKIKRK